MFHKFVVRLIPSHLAYNRVSWISPDSRQVSVAATSVMFQVLVVVTIISWSRPLRESSGWVVLCDRWVTGRVACVTKQTHLGDVRVTDT